MNYAPANQKRIVSVQDLSCFGKCSTTVALPVISSMGIECATLPTAILSTHTASGFTGFTVKDLTDELRRIIAHWQSLGITFNTIYTGYLGSPELVDLTTDFIKTFRDGATVFVDPVMADGGKLYPAFNNSYVDCVRNLCAAADIVVPNITEASLLLGCEYIDENHTDEYIRSMLQGLCALGSKIAIITGVRRDGLRGVMAYDSVKDEYSSYFRENIPCDFHGTGDVFSSAMCGALTLGMTLEASVKLAVDFTVDCILETFNDRDLHWYGVRFEKKLGQLSDTVRAAGLYK